MRSFKQTALLALALLAILPLGAAAQVSPADQLVSSGWENVRNGRLREAVTDFNQALRTDGEHTGAAEGLGTAALQMQDWPNAKRGFEAAHRLSPGNCGVTKSLAYVYLRLNLTDRAQVLYQEIIGSPGSAGCDPNDFDSKTNLGTLLYRSKLDSDRDMALQLFNQVINGGEDVSASNLYRAHFYLGNIYNKNKNYDLAISNFERAFEIEPDKTDGRSTLGRLYFNKKNYEKAVEHLTAVLSEQEHDYNTNLMLGLSYNEMGYRHQDDAIRFLAKTANLAKLAGKAPSNLPHQTLAKLYNNAGDADLAIKISDEGLALATGSSERAGLICTKAKGLESKGRYEDALELFESATEDPTWGAYALKQIERQENLIARREMAADN